MNFSELYAKAAKGYYQRNKSNFGYDGHAPIQYLERGKYVYMHISEYYKLPPQIEKLLRLRTIPKLHSRILIAELCLDIDWRDIEEVNILNPIPCSVCGKHKQHYRQVMLYKGSEICKWCHPEYTGQAVRRTANLLDWVQFMTETSETVKKFYVNCNPESVYYGDILIRYANRVDLLYNSKLLIDEICYWIQQVPGVHVPDWNSLSPYADQISMLTRLPKQQFTNAFLIGCTDLVTCYDGDDDYEGYAYIMELEDYRIRAVIYALNMDLYAHSWYNSFSDYQIDTYVA